MHSHPSKPLLPDGADRDLFPTPPPGDSLFPSPPLGGSGVSSPGSFPLPRGSPDPDVQMSPPVSPSGVRDTSLQPPSPQRIPEGHKIFHPYLNGKVCFVCGVNLSNLKHTARPCDTDGNYLAPGSPPIPLDDPSPDDWFPFTSRLEFETAEFLFKRNQMSAGDIDTLFELWGASLFESGHLPPFVDHKDLYKTIDEAKVGDISWENFKVS